jgi:hypothetical protein
MSIVFNHKEMLCDDSECYVIIIACWLLSVCMILFKDQTFDFIK